MARKLLRMLLLVNGLVMCLAAPAVLLPQAWMADIHARLGLGTMPGAPLFLYLCRTISVVYTLLGVISIIMYTDPVRYRPIILAFGWALVALGATVIGMGVAGELPAAWSLMEGPGTMAVGAATLLLLRVAVCRPPR